MSHGPKRSAHHEEEEHENHERWLVTYADMVTLLMVLFIVMFAMSQVDERKFMQLKNGLAAGFAHSSSVLPGADTLLEESGTSPITQIAPQLRPDTPTTEGGGPADGPSIEEAAHELAAMQEVRGLRDVEAELEKALAANGLSDDVQTSVSDRGLVVSLVSKHVTFHADQAELSARGAAVVDTLGPILAELPAHIEVSGHTNQAPGAPRYFATDWDLSAARAVAVLRRLNEVVGIPSERLSVAAYGNTQPLMDPSLPESQVVNKRVDLVLLSSSDEETRRLVKQYAESPIDSGAKTPAETLPETPAETPAGTQTETDQHVDAAGAVGASTKGTRQ